MIDLSASSLAQPCSMTEGRRGRYSVRPEVEKSCKGSQFFLQITHPPAYHDPLENLYNSLIFVFTQGLILKAKWWTVFELTVSPSSYSGHLQMKMRRKLSEPPSREGQISDEFCLNFITGFLHLKNNKIKFRKIKFS